VRKVLLAQAKPLPVLLDSFFQNLTTSFLAIQRPPWYADCKSARSGAKQAHPRFFFAPALDCKSIIGSKYRTVKANSSEY
ncbi:hypothetical protein ABTK14_22420, partial [Acinetobacter baumannii]